MHVLVTGGAGYIGSHTVRLLEEHGHTAWVYDNLARGHRAAVPSGRLLVGDLSDGPLLDRVLADKQIEGVIHFAGLTYVGESVTEPAAYYRNNVLGTMSLLDAMQRQRVPRIVFSSTAAVYGIPEDVPIREDDPCRPINPYGRSKLAIEWLIADYAAAYGLGYAALRYFNAAGAHPSGEIGEDHDPETHLIPIILQVALGQRPALQIYGDDYPTPDGTCVRDYIHVNDLAQAHLLALERIAPGNGTAYNLGNGKGYSVRDVVTACESVTGRAIPVEFAPRRAGDPPTLVASAQRAGDALGWKPQWPDIQAIVESAWNWTRTHPRGYGDAENK